MKECFAGAQGMVMRDKGLLPETGRSTLRSQAELQQDKLASWAQQGSSHCSHSRVGSCLFSLNFHSPLAALPKSAPTSQDSSLWLSCPSEWPTPRPFPPLNQDVPCQQGKGKVKVLGHHQLLVKHITFL